MNSGLAIVAFRRRKVHRRLSQELSTLKQFELASLILHLVRQLRRIDVRILLTGQAFFEERNESRFLLGG